MNAIKILARRKAINTKLAMLHAKQIALEEELYGLEKKCNHDVVVKLPKISTSDNLSSMRCFSEETYCLLCDEYLWPRKYLPKEDIDKIKKSVIIDLAKYPVFNSKIRKNWRKRLDSMYEDIAKSNPNLDAKEIAQKMITEIEAVEKTLST